MKCYKIFKTDKKCVKIEKGWGKKQNQRTEPVYAERLSKLRRNVLPMGSTIYASAKQWMLSMVRKLNFSDHFSSKICTYQQNKTHSATQKFPTK